MAYGKIEYTPMLFRALSLDEAHYAELAHDAAFNVGTGDFNVSCLIYVDSSITSIEDQHMILGKGAYDLDSDTGWWLGYNVTNKRLELTFNDGNASDVTIYTGDNSVLMDRWYWVLVNIDRSGNASFWIYDGTLGTGGLSSSSAVSGRTSSWDNTDAFEVGSFEGATANRLFKGYISYIRLDVGNLKSNAWIAEEWLKIKYGLNRIATGETETWLFADDLVGSEENAFELTWMGGDSDTYVDCFPYSTAPITYSFVENYNRGYEFGYLDLDDRQRAIDGGDYTDAGPLKRYFRLPFSHLKTEQQIALLAAYQSRESFKLFLDGDEPYTSYVKFNIPPPFTNQFIKYAEVTIELEEP